MDQTLFAIFNDPSYSDQHRVNIAEVFVDKSSLPYTAALRRMARYRLQSMRVLITTILF